MTTIVPAKCDSHKVEAGSKNNQFNSADFYGNRIRNEVVNVPLMRAALFDVNDTQINQRCKPWSATRANISKRRPRIMWGAQLSFRNLIDSLFILTQ